ncbi:unnamed protein product [Mesocestoides corti]|uniref:Uncharacterized protein n=1 Tax=Mesocestoides corti TaxID=53468 RepID=A0A0R3UAG4_MESCO|nr:unnamed protein product [Mesocestoides corti]
MRLLTNLSLSLLLLLLLFTHTRMVVCSDEVESQHLEARQVEEVDVEPVDAVDSMLGSGGKYLPNHDIGDHVEDNHDVGVRVEDDLFYTHL